MLDVHVTSRHVTSRHYLWGEGVVELVERPWASPGGVVVRPGQEQMEQEQEQDQEQDQEQELKQQE